MSTPFNHTVSAAGPACGFTFTGRSNLTGEVGLHSDAPLIIALHGGTYSSEYFDIAGHSLLDNAAVRGIPVIALDRPNYVGSSPLATEGSIIEANAEVLGAAIGSIWDELGGDSAGIVLVAHSIGGAAATIIASTPQTWPLLGLATSGCLVRVPAESAGAWAALPDIPMIDLPVPLKDQLMFGPVETYDDAMPAASYPSNTLVPKAELLDITGGWIARRAETTAKVAVPVHHRQAEFDHLWVTDQGEVNEYRAGFTSAPSIDAQLQLGAGHCIDFHLPSDEFQNSQLDFAQRCLSEGLTR
ncbi:alpha/beta hydrolase [Cryobacterium adonitolivorans]|uniref:Alpha/beta hydrolase n=1 Tax=Cryobacterium adonitolivorans TaxID=1259189 RepID=A0A4R8W612_9MICO|nr:alpha/beta hydrolase [Cryobacterium adonitolivorans]TFC01076.1 alpha/beta hydrolase [Cryobacterium adonitolivorans]